MSCCCGACKVKDSTHADWCPENPDYRRTRVDFADDEILEHEAGSLYSKRGSTWWAWHHSLIGWSRTARPDRRKLSVASSSSIDTITGKSREELVQDLENKVKEIEHRLSCVLSH